MSVQRAGRQRCGEGCLGDTTASLRGGRLGGRRDARDARDARLRGPRAADAGGFCVCVVSVGAQLFLECPRRTFPRWEK